MSKKVGILRWFQPFLVCAMAFVCLMVLLKAVFGAVQHDVEGITLQAVLISIADTVVAAGLMSLLILLVYALLRLLSDKVAVIVAAFLFAFLLLLEVSLTVFTMKSGALMDNEIFLRPFGEVVETMKNGVDNLWLILGGFVVFIVFYCWLMCIVVNKIKLGKLSAIIVSAFLVSASSLFWLVPILEDTTNPNVRNVVTNKTWYLLRSLSSDDIKAANVAFDGAIAEEYIGMHSDRVYPDCHYPMEFVDDTKDNLSQFFNDSNVSPNIVIVVVESLGSEWMGTNRADVPVMPFVDSLSRQSLYWENCLSTTPRSFGVVPSLTGSVPCGVRGYQFGNMPQTNSLISILKSNGYETNAFYAGQFYFDCVAEYLISQEIDFMSDFYSDFEAENDNNKGGFWGYHDGIMFDKSMQVLEGKNSPMMNLFVTISTHDDVKEDNPIFADAIKKVDEIGNLDRKKAAMYVYADDCLRKFFADYSRRDDYENTIFVVTGDHSSGFYLKSDLSRYHVPLIIYSPLLKEPKKFKNIVTHNDLAPSLVTLMRNKYYLETPEKACWAGNFLGIDEGESQSEMLFVEYAKGITKMLSNGYLYVKNDDKTYKINEDMTLKDASGDPYHKVIRRKFDVYKYVNDYVYLNDMLVSDKSRAEEYEKINKYSSSKTIECQTGEWKTFSLMPKVKIPGDWEKIKISLSADVSFLDEVPADQYIDLYFYCVGENQKYPSFYTDKIIKFLTVDKVEIGKWYKLDIEKEFVVRDATDLKCSVYTYYSRRTESNRVLFKNIDVKISGVSEK